MDFPDTRQSLDLDKSWTWHEVSSPPLLGRRSISPEQLKICPSPWFGFQAFDGTAYIWKSFVILVLEFLNYLAEELSLLPHLYVSVCINSWHRASALNRVTWGLSQLPVQGHLPKAPLPHVRGGYFYFLGKCSPLLHIWQPCVKNHNVLLCQTFNNSASILHCLHHCSIYC